MSLKQEAKFDSDFNLLEVREILDDHDISKTTFTSGSRIVELFSIDENNLIITTEYINGKPEYISEIKPNYNWFAFVGPEHSETCYDSLYYNDTVEWLEFFKIDDGILKFTEILEISYDFKNNGIFIYKFNGCRQDDDLEIETIRTCIDNVGWNGLELYDNYTTEVYDRIKTTKYGGPKRKALWSHLSDVTARYIYLRDPKTNEYICSKQLPLE